MELPKVLLNIAMTLDGKISTKEGDSRISCEEDLDRVHKLRLESDAIMVGIGTVMADDPYLTVRRVEGKNPSRIIIDSRGRVPSDKNVLNNSAKTIIGVSEKIEEKDKKRLRSKNAQVIVAGRDRVDLRELLKTLKNQGIEKILLEGGSTLNWGMLKERLVDEVRVAVKSCIVGGRNAKTMVDGDGVDQISECVDLNLIGIEKVGKDLLLKYKVEGN